MSKDRATTTYKQCGMTQGTEKGTKQHVAWIPSQFAVKGKVLDIDDHGDGWKVNTVAGNEITAKVADAQSQMYKKTRKASDI